MAARSAIKNLISNLCFEHHCVQTIKLQEQFRKLHNGVNQCSHYHSSSQLRAQPRLTPQEVTDILRQNEHTHEFSAGGSVKAYDSNQLPSNDPIEDTHAEARCLLTTGMLLGVFDGHGGAACAQVVAKRLFNYVSVSLLPPDLLYKYLQSMDNGDSHVQLLENFNDQYDLVDELKGLYSESFKRFVSDLWDSQRDDFQMRDALQKAFLKLDDDLSREALTNVTEKVNLKTLSVSMAGSVACVAHIDGPHLHVASVGDCQAVLGVLSDTDTWTAKKISIEHNTDNQVEVNRILDEHPHHERDTVIRMERLLGQLAPLRAFGDFRNLCHSFGLNQFSINEDHARCLPAAQRFALLALLEKNLTRVVPNLKPRSLHDPRHLTAELGEAFILELISSTEVLQKLLNSSGWIFGFVLVEEVFPAALLMMVHAALHLFEELSIISSFFALLASFKADL
ncbi:[Pyruvate dehydrogenase [acetyl-transferring]]-phosphatase 1, mitochondrial [Homalodisca vitripennis]|nr:[Pyruvate dehydrogenase [acetyl-transferring]]-phosphatase 1, mitochondrial [Homalodisca vitripennis]